MTVVPVIKSTQLTPATSNAHHKKGRRANGAMREGSGAQLAQLAGKGPLPLLFAFVEAMGSARAMKAYLLREVS
jgi:hypothetical protein